MATKDQCEICEKPAEIIWRIEQTEGDMNNLHTKFAVTKKEIFDKMQANIEATDKKLDRLNTYLIGTLTTVLISLLLLTLNLITKTMR